jgi:uncharacterized protein (TIGR00369 family)
MTDGENRRTGAFWDGVTGRAPMPPAARTLGLEVVAVDPDEGTIDLTFTAPEAFTNPAGNVLGAFLAAMLYDTVGPALLATLGPDEFQSTMDMHTTFRNPVRPGRIAAHGHVTHRVGDVASMTAELTRADGVVIASATATARVIPLAEAPAAA